MLPVIGIVCDTSSNGKHLYHQVGDKYITALRNCSNALPVLLPSLEKAVPPIDFLDLVDGVLFTGGYANVQRQLYGLPPAPESEAQDLLRDQNSLPLIKATVERGIPMFGICRGFQELNVAYGGTLFPRLHEVPGRIDHREDQDAPIDVQYGSAHAVTPKAGGEMERLFGAEPFQVNSVHMQGVDRIADGLQIEAVADDGTIEAMSVAGSMAFSLAVQWHPEWKATENPFSVKLFQTLGQKAAKYQEMRLENHSRTHELA